MVEVVAAEVPLGAAGDGVVARVPLAAAAGTAGDVVEVAAAEVPLAVVGTSGGFAARRAWTRLQGDVLWHVDEQRWCADQERWHADEERWHADEELAVGEEPG